MDSSKGLDYTPEVRDVESVRTDTKKASSEIFDIIDLKGAVTKTGVALSSCGELDSEHYFKISHPWSVYDVPVGDMKKAMERLKRELPKNGWKIARYAPDSSPSRSLELVADSTKKKFSVSVTLYDAAKASESTAEPRTPSAKKISGIMVRVVSACYKVPKGKTTNDEF
ncbi:hypothetical protein [Streptomyces sp. H27-D2]|uniref:hypothetical protein n=1 Tax=Streptomyces sp. H27-D2 TaxID=3046304 RepID=UPI002DB960B3|nr:hypothetical protein [Streptomyces sp. H27-D2]MEC4017134.1 hypothetical protein [Streptomyces sp. H27-D2]